MPETASTRLGLNADLSSVNFLRTHNSLYVTYDSTASSFRSPLRCGGIPGEASAVWDAELSCSAPACRACCPDLQTCTGHDANFGTLAVPCHWLPCVEFVLHPTPAASQAGASTSITTSRRPITREPRAPSASSQWRRGEMHPRTGAMERRCHTADHSLSAESCNGTPFSGILRANLALGRSRLLELAAISTARSRVWPACKGSSISRRLFRLIPAYSLDIQPRLRGSRDWHHGFSFNRGPLVAFRVDQTQRTTISIELTSLSSNIKYKGKSCALGHSYQKSSSSG